MVENKVNDKTMEEIQLKDAMIESLKQSDNLKQSESFLYLFFVF